MSDSDAYEDVEILPLLTQGPARPIDRQPPKPPPVSVRHQASAPAAMQPKVKKPIVPPKPPARSISMKRRSMLKDMSHKLALDDRRLSVPIDAKAGEKLSLARFSKKYADSLPVQVKVSKGFYGMSDRSSLSEGDVFNIHFIKHMRVVTIEDEYGIQYTVPINSAHRFSLLYDPASNPQQAASSGFNFKHVSDLMMKPMPKVVCTQTAFQYGSKLLLEENEILIIKRIEDAGSRKALRVYSSVTKEEKILPEHCMGNFTTHPHSIGLHLPEIVAEVGDLFPSKALVLTDSDIPPKMLTFLKGTVTVCLLSSTTEISLVATSASEMESEQYPQLTDIPVNLDVEVDIVTPSPSQAQQLYEKTKYLYNTFNPANLLPFARNDHTSMEAQSYLYTTVTTGHECEGLQLQGPIAASTSPNTTPGAENSTRLEVSEKKLDNASNTQEVLIAISQLKDEVLQLRSLLDQCIQGINSACKLESKSACHSAQIDPPTEDRDMDQSKACLASLSCDQVIYY